MRVFPWAWLVGAGVALLGACTTPIDPGYERLLRETPLQGEGGSVANTLGVGDKLVVRVYGEPTLGGEYVVPPEGTISFPLIGKLAVDGLTCASLEDRIGAELQAGYLRQPSVSCSVLEYNSKKVFVFGEVKTPGNLRYVDDMSVVQAIAQSGGFSERAAPNETTLVRVVQGQKVKVRVPVAAIMAGEVENLPLKPGDILVVPDTIY